MLGDKKGARLNPQTIKSHKAMEEYLENPTPENRDKAIVEHMPTVYWVAWKKVYPVAGKADREDLIGVGITELIRCIDEYDPEKGKWFAYLKTCLKGVMLNLLNEKEVFQPSYHGPLDESGNRTLLDIFPAKSDKMSTERKEFLLYILDQLDPEDRLLLDQYFGITIPPMYGSEIAEDHGVSRQAIHKRIEKVLQRAKQIAQAA